MYETLDEYKSDPVDAEQLEEIKSRQRYGFLMDLNSPDNVAGSLARYVALTGGIDVVDQYYATLDEITPADIQQIASEYFVEDHRNVVTLKGAQK